MVRSMPEPHAACDQSPPSARRLVSASGVCVTTTAGAVPPVRSAPLPVIGPEAPPTGDRVTVYGPPAEPVTVAAAHGVPRARTAVCTVAAAALYARLPVVAPPMLSVNVPPVGVPVMVTSCTREPWRRYEPDTPRL